MQFKDIIGQRELINRLTSIIDSGKVPHAQLFLGKAGYGSLPLAIAYAQYLNCSNKQHYAEGELHADSCGECPSCKKFLQLMHPDLHFYFPTAISQEVKKDPCSSEFQGQFREFLNAHRQYATLEDWYQHIGIENKQGLINVRDASELLKSLSLKAYEAPFKVVVVWMVEKMNGVAANKLLKFIEEPSPNTLILMVAERQDLLLDTILSRTQPVRIGRISMEDLAQAFPGQDSDFVQACEGDYVQGRKLLEQSEQEQRFASMFVPWMRQLFKLNMASLSAWVDEMAGNTREVQKQFLAYAMEAVRACYLQTAAGYRLGHRLQFGDEKFNSFFPNFVTANNIERLNEAFTQTRFAIERNANPKIAFMQLSFDVSKALSKK